MKSLVFLGFFLLSFFVMSCSSDNSEEFINESNYGEFNNYVEIEFTPEMISFKEALSDLRHQKVAGQLENDNPSPLNPDNHNTIIEPAKIFLISVGYNESKLKEMNDNKIIQTALKEYAYKTQLRSIN